MPLSLWSRTLKSLSDAAPIGTIVHLGAGEGRLVPDFLTAGARHIVLQEPNRAFHAALKRLSEDEPTIEVLESALSTVSGQHPFMSFNVARQSSLRQPTQLLALYPALKEVRKTVLETVTMDQVVQTVAMDADLEHILIIDCPGEEKTALDQLADLPTAKTFTHVFLRAGCLPLYHGSLGVDALAEQLKTQGFEIKGESHADADFTHLVFTKPRVTPARTNDGETAEGEHPRVAEIRDLHRRLDQSERLAERLHADLEDLRARYGELLKHSEIQANLLGQLAGRLGAKEPE